MFNELKYLPNFFLEDQFYSKIVAGIDEAGRGPWAGPVVAAAVVLNKDNLPIGINDSKKLSIKKRDELFNNIQNLAQIGIGIASVEEIDTLNILQATMLAMQRAVDNLPAMPDVALIDGNKSPILPCYTETIIQGDSKCLSIAAASIIAKVTRDRIMEELAKEYNMYGWERNAGYGTKDHIKGLEEYGVSKYHRKSYAPIKKIIMEKEKCQVSI
jgi:ribonuclease HII